MNLTDSQKTILKSSFSYLEDLLINSPSAQLKLPQKLVEIGSYTFIYETATDYSHRIISGQEVIDWIIKMIRELILKREYSVNYLVKNKGFSK